MRRVTPRECYRSRMSSRNQGQPPRTPLLITNADLQPSELAPSSSALLAELIPKYLDPEGYAVVLGAVDQTTQLLEKQWGHSKLPPSLAELTSSPIHWIWKGWEDRSCSSCQDFDSYYSRSKLVEVERCRTIS